jgi:hypothetical protein
MDGDTISQGVLSAAAAQAHTSTDRKQDAFCVLGVKSQGKPMQLITDCHGAKVRLTGCVVSVRSPQSTCCADDINAGCVARLLPWP